MSDERGVRLTRVSTIMLAVSDLERTVAFYRDVLGVPLKFATEEFAFLDGGGIMIGLRRSATLPQDENVRAEVVFEVDDIDAAHRSLSERGVRFRIAPRLASGDRYVADFRDPDGNVLTLYGPRGPGASG